MATDKQMAANRRNAAKSTGPRTEEGKAVASQNALIHGLRARTLVLPFENPAEFEQLCHELIVDRRPVGHAELSAVGQMAEAEWRIARINRAEQLLFRRNAFKLKNDLELKCFGFTRYRAEMENADAEEQIPLEDDLMAEIFEKEHAVLASYSQQRARLERSWSRALKELHRLQDRRAREPKPPLQPEESVAPKPAPKPEPASPEPRVAETEPQVRKPRIVSPEPRVPETEPQVRKPRIVSPEARVAETEPPVRKPRIVSPQARVPETEPPVPEPRTLFPGP